MASILGLLAMVDNQLRRITLKSKPEAVVSKAVQ